MLNISQISKPKYFFPGLSILSIAGLLGIVGFSLITAQNLDNSNVLGASNKKYILRYSDTKNGALTFTGNSLGLTDPKVVDNETAGSFTTTNTSLVNAEFGPGSTDKWLLNNSKANLSIPKNAQVLYAELIWGGNYKYDTQDISKDLNRAVKFTLPNNKVIEVTPDPITAALIPESSAYVRSANVTSLVKETGAGSYTVGAVPAVLDRTNPYNNYAGWTLAVAYEDKSVFPRNLNIFVGSQQVGADQVNSAAEVTGFNTPASGQVSGRLLVSAQEGDSMYSGDQMRFGSDPKSLNVLSGPNNQANNFFAGQINNDQGKLDTTGSFGKANLSIGKNSGLRRQGWDVSNVDISKHLKNSQTTAYAQGTSMGDVYVLNALGIQIDANAANPIVQLSVDKSQTFVGDTLTYSIEVNNNGTADSLENLIKADVPAGTSLVTGSIKLDGANCDCSLSRGIGISNIKVGKSAKISYQVKVDSIPKSGEYRNQAKLDYSYQMLSGATPVNGTRDSNQVVTTASVNPLHPPIANDDEAKTTQGVAVDIKVLDNDTDRDGDLDISTFEIISNPRFGTVFWNGRVLNYKPQPDYLGKDTVQYKICDKSGFCDTAIVSIEVTTKPLRAPVANPDKTQTEFNKPATIKVLDNDSDSDGNLAPATLRILPSDKPSFGKIDLVNGAVVYTPNKDYVGTDTYTYEICDTTALCANSTIEIEVLPAPLPQATDDTAQTTNGQIVNIGILKNDSFEISPADIESVEIVSKPLQGEAKWDIFTSSLVYTPNSNFAGTDSFEYKVCNILGGCDTAIVQVTNSSPVQMPDPEVVGVSSSSSDSSPSSNSSQSSTGTPSSSSSSISTSTTTSSSNSGSVAGSNSSKDPALNDFKGVNPLAGEVQESVSTGGQVLGVMEDVRTSLVRTGGGAIASTAFFAITFLVGVIGTFLSWKKPTANEIAD